MTDMSDFGRLWDDLWSVPPLSHWMYGLVPARTLHSLPLSERHAESPEQRVEVVRRHHHVLDAMRGDTSTAVLLTYSVAIDETEARPDPSIVSEWIVPDDPGEPVVTMRAHGRRVVIEELALDEMFLEAADGHLDFALVAPDAAWMFAPYSGGVDLFDLDEPRLVAVWGARPAWHSGNCECPAHDSRRLRWHDHRLDRANHDIPSPHECDDMTQARMDRRVPVEYDAVLREWIIREPGHPYSVAMEHCPWCGDTLPASLSGPYHRKAFEVLGHRLGEWPDPIRPAMPIEYQSDEWWRGRFDIDDDGEREQEDGTWEAVMADELPRRLAHPMEDLLQHRDSSGRRSGEPVLRRAAASDVPDVLALWAVAGENDARPTDSAEDVHRLRELDPGALILAVVENQVVGSVIIGWDGWRCHLYRLAVHPEHRRSGIGRRLIEHAEERFRDVGGKRADAMVLDGNDLGAATWRAHGYAPQAEWSRWVKPL